jgi:hypothetical protein
VMPLTATSRAAFGLALSSGLLTANARAVAETCVEPTISVELPPGAEWQTAAEQLGEHLRGLSDLDKCAHVSVRAEGHGVILEINTSDGRGTSRRVNSVAELLRAAEALLVLPPRVPAPSPSPAPATSVSPQELPPPDAPRAKPASQSIQVELGIGAALRFGGGPTYFAGGAAAFAEFALDRWLLAVTARYEITTSLLNQPAPSDFVMQSSAVGVSAGRRLELGSVDVDGLLGPNLVLENEDADDVDRDVAGAAADLRLGATVRVSGPPSSSVRAFASGDFEASPARIRSAKSLDRVLPNLPSWTSGVAVGVLWGAR